MSFSVLYSALSLMVLIFVHRPSLSHLLVSRFLLPLLLVPFVSPTSYFRTFVSFYTLFSWAHFCVLFDTSNVKTLVFVGNESCSTLSTTLLRLTSQSNQSKATVIVRHSRLVVH